MSIDHGLDGEIVTPDHNSSERVITVCPGNDLQIKDYEEHSEIKVTVLAPLWMIVSVICESLEGIFFLNVLFKPCLGLPECVEVH